MWIGDSQGLLLRERISRNVDPDRAFLGDQASETTGIIGTCTDQNIGLSGQVMGLLQPIRSLLLDATDPLPVAEFLP
jgi:hypothetical protein